MYMPIEHCLFLLLAMIWCHILDDFVLQGHLAQMKQRNWWRSLSEYKDMYKNDWIIALLCHGFSWSFSIHIPIMIYLYCHHIFNPLIVSLSIILQMVFHCIIDTNKANNHKINLVQDQCMHLVQLIFTILLFAVC